MSTETSTKNREVVRSLYEDCINRGKGELLVQSFAPDFVGANGERGPEGYAQTIASVKTGTPDVQFRIDDLVATDDKVVVRWSWEGTHTGPFRGFPATHKRITNTGIAIYHFRDGKIVRAWLETDRLGVLQQIGAIPEKLAPAAPPAKP
ncbi:ester cyclase [Pendulispora albinea]|uniref:Ester cyclase n=1 Tax=Pendulispora albinea TaxID=2741071 RepID=A0ABZ2LWA0_9BACT